MSTPRASGDERPPVVLVPARRWLIAVALVVLLLAGVVFLSIATTRSPVRGIAFAYRGGYATVASPVAGFVQNPVLKPGSPVRRGEVIARVEPVQGAAVDVRSPVNGVVTQLAGPPAGWSTGEGETVATVAEEEQPRSFNALMVLPGEESSAVTSGKVSTDVLVWLEPAGELDFQCRIVGVVPYAQGPDSIAKVNPDPVVVAFARGHTSLLYTTLDCPNDRLEAFSRGEAIPAVVKIDPRTPWSYVVGRR